MRVMGMCGSLRNGSYDRAVLQAAVELAPRGMEIRAWDRLREVPHYDGGVDADGARPAPVEDLKRTIAGADGLLLISPEYDYGVPGVLKNTIDRASRPGGTSVFVGEPAAVAGPARVPSAPRAGRHTCARSCTPATRVMPHSGVLVNFAAQKIADGRLADEPTRAFLAGFLEHFATWIRAQRGG